MTRAKMRADDRRWRRGDTWTILAAMALGIVLAAILISIRDLQRDLNVANEARDALATQVQDLGAVPIAGKPGSRGDMGPEGDPGPPGPIGPTGPVGPIGKTGPTGATGQKGDTGDAGINGVSVTGSPGTDGQRGNDGVAGPPGPAGVRGEPGPAGPQGEQGPPGVDGEDGEDGQPCPDGYSPQAPSYDPDALVCRRDGAPQPDPTPEPSTPLAKALDPQRRMYV
jgi:hypothetical protein